MPIVDRMARAWRALTGPQPQHRPIQRSFAGAAISRLTASLPGYSLAVNADLDGSLVILRARARNLEQNHKYGKRYMTLVANNVVGDCGPTLQVRAMQDDGKALDQPANSAIESHWAKWGCRCDVRGQSDLPHLLRTAVKTVARDGEVLVRFVRDSRVAYGLQLQFLEADRLVESINTTLKNGNVIRQGVESDGYGCPVAYHVRTAHPGENFYNRGNPSDIERVLARDMLHLFLPERFEQVRGHTWLHAVLNRANMLQGYEEAAVVAARVGAAKMGVFTRTDTAPPTPLGEGMAEAKDDFDNFQISAEAGEFFDLPPGYDLKSWNPDYPHQNFESFMTQCLRGMSAGLDVAAHNLSGNMTDVNYSSARIAELSERDAWKVLQGWFIHAACKRIFDEWLQTATLTNSITFPASGRALPAEKAAKFIDAARFQGRRWTWIDPMKEIGANIEAINARLKSRTAVTAETGVDFEELMSEIAAEEQTAEDAGVELPKDQPSLGAIPADPEETPKKPKAVAKATAPRDSLKQEVCDLKKTVDAFRLPVSEIQKHLHDWETVVSAERDVVVNLAGRVNDVASKMTDDASRTTKFMEFVVEKINYLMQHALRTENVVTELHQRGRADETETGKDNGSPLELRGTPTPEQGGGTEVHSAKTEPRSASDQKERGRAGHKDAGGDGIRAEPIPGVDASAAK